MKSNAPPSSSDGDEFNHHFALIIRHLVSIISTVEKILVWFFVFPSAQAYEESFLQYLVQ